MLIVREVFRIAGRFAAFCIAVFLCAPIAAAQTGNAGTETAAMPAPAAKKKIAIAQFDVANTLHVDDISNIYDGLPSLLANRLEAGGKFLAAYSGRPVPAETGEAQREAITRIAAETGAQFVVSGLVANAGVSHEKGFWGTSIERQIEVECSVYDGLTGARLLSRRWHEQADGEARVGNDKPFGSAIFLRTEFGKATSRLIDSAVKELQDALGNAPFSANIVRVEGKRVYLDAGSDARLKPGDKLVAYAGGTRIAGLKGATLGVTDRATDIITLTSVQPQFSIGELSEEAAKSGITTGHVAKIDPAAQLDLEARQLATLQAAKAEQAAREEVERMKAEQAAKAEAERIKAEQAAKAEAERAKAEKKAKAQAAAEAKAAKSKAARKTRAAPLSAAQEARAREEAQAARATARARQEAARAEAARAETEKKAQAEAGKQAAADAKAARRKAAQEASAEAEHAKAEKKTQAKAAAKAKEQAAAKPGAGTTPKSAKEKTVQKTPARREVRAVAVEDMEREAAEAAAASAPPEAKKPGVPLKLKQIKP